MPDRPTYVCGLDLGQASDYTALVVIERPPGPSPRYLIRFAHRYDLGTPYTGPDPARPGVLERLRATLRLPPLPGSTLAVDQTGVGRAVVDLLRGGALPCGLLLPVTITAGSRVTQEPDLSVRVPKADLVACLKVLFDARRLATAPDLPLAPALERELRSFTSRITPALNETYSSWRERDHDDLVLAAALAAWAAERYPDFGRASIGTGGNRLGTAPPGVFGTARGGGRPGKAPPGVFRS